MLVVAFGSVKRLAYGNLRNRGRGAKRLAFGDRAHCELTSVIAQAERITSG
jgi:hypothetical protein